MEAPLECVAQLGLDESELERRRAAYRAFRMGKGKGLDGEFTATTAAPQSDDSQSDSPKSSLETKPFGLRQPFLKDGQQITVKNVGEVYQNGFGRPGKELRTDILIYNGAIQKLDKFAKVLIPELCHNATNFLITDSVIDPLYGSLVLEGLCKAGLAVHKIVVPADETDASGESTGEPHKTTEVLLNCCNDVIGNGVSKHSCIISLGGGVVNNLCGVVASMVYRGISLVHITTTSMGMLDAAIDFKQAVNHPMGKNLLGSYYPASMILMDPALLSSLSERHVLNGIAEALKHGLAQSPELVRAIVEPLQEGKNALRDPRYLEKICKMSIEIKCPTLDFYHDSDYNEMVPQYGHAVGHAVEHLSWSGTEHHPLLHGEAVCVGMCVSAEIAHLLDVCDKECVDEHYQVVLACGLPAFIPESLSLEAIKRKMMFDKHFVKKPAMGLTAKVGQMAPSTNESFSWSIDDTILEAALLANICRRDGVQQVPLSNGVNLVSAYAKSTATNCC